MSVTQSKMLDLFLQHLDGLRNAIVDGSVAASNTAAVRRYGLNRERIGFSSDLENLFVVQEFKDGFHEGIAWLLADQQRRADLVGAGTSATAGTSVGASPVNIPPTAAAGVGPASTIQGNDPGDENDPRPSYRVRQTLRKSIFSWLPRDVMRGEIVRLFTGATYGCIGPGGRAVVLAGEKAFTEIPNTELERI